MLDGLGGQPAKGEWCALSGTEKTVVYGMLDVAQTKVGNLHLQTLTNLCMQVRYISVT